MDITKLPFQLVFDFIFNTFQFPLDIEHISASMIIRPMPRGNGVDIYFDIWTRSSENEMKVP